MTTAGESASTAGEIGDGKEDNRSQRADGDAAEKLRAPVDTERGKDDGPNKRAN
jgi:hypothetical protein